MVNMSPKEAYKRCCFEKRRIPELESIIANDPNYSYCYARHIIKGRFIEGERRITIDPIYSYCYARDIIKGRFIEGEKSIINDIEYTYRYARDVIKDAFPLCHHIIFNSEWRDEYIEFLKSINYDLNEIGEWLI